MIVVMLFARRYYGNFLEVPLWLRYPNGSPGCTGSGGFLLGRVRAVLRGRGVGRVVRPPNRARGYLTGSPPGARVRFYAVRGRAGGEASLSRQGIQ